MKRREAILLLLEIPAFAAAGGHVVEREPSPGPWLYVEFPAGRIIPKKLQKFVYADQRDWEFKEVDGLRLFQVWDLKTGNPRAAWGAYVRRRNV